MNRQHGIVFGATDKPDKTIIAYKDKNGMYALKICELVAGNSYQFGEEASCKPQALAEDVTGEYTTLYFAEKNGLKSIDAMIAMLQRIKEWMMMNEQIQFIPCGDEDVDDLKRQALLMQEHKRKRKAWEAAFQRWSDKQMFDETTSYGKCGYGAMCDWCNDSGKGRACVRALNAMCREKNVTIDYDNRNFEEIWRCGK